MLAVIGVAIVVVAARSSICSFAFISTDLVLMLPTLLVLVTMQAIVDMVSAMIIFKDLCIVNVVDTPISVVVLSWVTVLGIFL